MQETALSGVNPHTIGRLAVDSVKGHVNNQADCRNARLPEGATQCVKRDNGRLVQRVKANTAALWIVDGSGEQVIQVYQHGQQHGGVGEAPPATEKNGGYDGRYENV